MCWVGEVTSTSGTCASPGPATNYETMSYNGSGDLTGTSKTGTYGSNSAITWNVDTNEPTCVNPSGTTCTGQARARPSSTGL